jgi:anaerobic selenocysteine-containing dehydrogenase
LIAPSSERTISSTLGELRPNLARVRIHPDDAHARSIAEGESVRVFNALGEVQCEATVTPEIRPGTVSLPSGLWARSTYNGSTATALVSDAPSDVNGARVQVELWARH